MNDLTIDDPQLREINFGYRELARSRGENLNHLVFYEMHRTIFGRIVDPGPADPGLNCRPIPIKENHINISKPLTREDLIYIETKAIILQLVDNNDDTGKLQIYERESFKAKLTWIHTITVAARSFIMIAIFAAAYYVVVNDSGPSPIDVKPSQVTATVRYIFSMDPTEKLPGGPPVGQFPSKLFVEGTRLQIGGLSNGSRNWPPKLWHDRLPSNAPILLNSINVNYYDDTPKITSIGPVQTPQRNYGQFTSPNQIIVDKGQWNKFSFRAVLTADDSNEMNKWFNYIKKIYGEANMHYFYRFYGPDTEKLVNSGTSLTPIPLNAILCVFIDGVRVILLEGIVVRFSSGEGDSSYKTVFREPQKISERC